ncbi:MAG: LON peptidase substrate-binding domain-containing protein [Acidimicrobiales bacterium]
MTDAVTLPVPMFPLGSVLFPHMMLSLHVFEPRYRALVSDALRHGQEFGVVLIERGAEVGGGDSRFGIGTIARIVEAAEFPDGRWALLCTGVRRVRVSAWLPDDPYPMALVDSLQETACGAEGPELLARAEREVRRALALAGEFGEAPAPSTAELDADPLVAAYQLAAIAPLGPVDHQRLLEEDDAGCRLSLLATMAADASTLFAYRLSGT